MSETTPLYESDGFFRMPTEDEMAAIVYVLGQNPYKAEWIDDPAPAAKTSARDIQVGGDHYKKAIQPWDIIDAFDLDFYEGNALKYLLRRKTNRLEDLKKCAHYIQACIEREESK